MKNIFTKSMMMATLLFATANLWGQVNTFPYKCGFEVATENANWVTVPDSHNPANTWSIGSAVFQSGGGTNSLYVSDDGGTSAHYNDAATTVIFAYREFTLPANKSFSFSYNYRKFTTPNDSLFVCWVEDATIPITVNSDGSMPSWVTTTAKAKIGLSTVGTAYSTNNSFSINCGTGVAAKLVFVFKKGAVPITNRVVCIDNIWVNECYNTYYTGFDNADEQAGWTLYNNATCVNRWVVGSAVSITEPNALYVSPDGGSTYGYDGSKPGYVSAVKELSLSPGNYYLDFDWMTTGDDNDFMYVAIQDSSYTNWTNAIAMVPSAMTTKALAPIGRADAKLNKALKWQHAKVPFTSNGIPVKLVFFWINNSVATHPPSAAVDNVEVHRVENAATCPAPSLSVTMLGGRANITIIGTSTYYEVGYRNVYEVDGRFENLGIFPNNPPLNTVTIPPIENLDKGFYSFFVRGICENAITTCTGTINDTTAWVVSHHNMVINGGSGCINYADFGSASCLAQIGKSIRGTTAVIYQNLLAGVVDHGQNDIESRHTVVTDVGWDPRTNNELRTVPHNEVAAVRLGNWKTGAEAERLTYTFFVDSTYAIIVMQYAVVLEDPEHPAYSQPRFTLEILNQDNELIDSDCGMANFIPGVNTSEWTNVGDVVWKDWTTIGLNLIPYIGQQVKIRLTTYDCSETGHYGYAYFTIKCTQAKLKGLSCGEGQNKALVAPEGFNYNWYKLNPGQQASSCLQSVTSVSTDRSFAPQPNDLNTYVCRCSFKEMAGCCFNLTANLSPRWPEAAGTWRHVPENCVNKIALRDQSVITYENNVANEPVDDVAWTITGAGITTPITSVEKNPVIVVPNAGGTFTVQLIAGLTGLCHDTTSFQINVPPVGGGLHEELTICTARLPFNWRGRQITEAGFYRDTIHDTGCETIYSLDLKVANEILVRDSATICDGDSIIWQGAIYRQAGVHSVIYGTTAGCDSIIELNLTVNPVMQLGIEQIPQICATEAYDFTIKYQMQGGSEPTNYALKFKSLGAKNDNKFTDSTEALSGDIVVPVPVNIRPDKYRVEIEFEDTMYNCKGTKLEVPFEVAYPSWVIEQNWNDVIALLNSNYNGPNKNNVGSYEFDQYQWYKNGVPMEGEVKSYIYISSGLEVGASYKLHIRRTGEDYSIFTCPIVVKPYSDAQSEPNIFPPSGIIRLNALSNGTADIWTVTGILVSSNKISVDSPLFTAPSKPGIYVMSLKYDNGIQKSYKIVVSQ
ncbi:MAG: T9SS type A sorting domain-containing protein [Prevotellaceae bacterium]|jgi:hypothetical protein|nr:T9SS type A sorting domain-containing protein [Prevotellaceae bacterium]